MASPTCLVNATSTVNGVDVAATSTYTIALQDTAGVKQWQIICLNTDDFLVGSTITAGLTVNTTTKTATGVAPAGGSALIFQSVVNGGKTNGIADPSLTTTFAIFVRTATGYRVGAFNEFTEGSAAFGWMTKFNAIVRNALGSAAGAGNGIAYSGGAYSVLADPEGSIVVTSSGVKVGVLASDAEHGNRGNGSLHSVATGSAAGFMPSAMWTIVNGIASGGSPSAQPSVPIATGVAANLLTAAPFASGVPVPVNSSVIVRAVIKGTIVTPTQVVPMVLTIFQVFANVNGTLTLENFATSELTDETYIPTGPWSQAVGLSLTVSGAANNMSGLVRLAISTPGGTVGLPTGSTVVVAGVTGTGGLTAAANGPFTATVVDSMHIDLQGSTFSGTYTSGGTVTPQACVAATFIGTNVMLQATGLTPAPWEQSQTVRKWDFRVANGNIYVCSTAGTTAVTGTGPSGTGNAIGDGSAAWDYVGAVSAGVTVNWTVTKLEVL